jgi:hypothetical protein
MRNLYMRIGDPSHNRSIGCTTSRTSRLSSYSDNRLRDMVQENLACLIKIFAYNENTRIFFTVISDLVSVCIAPGPHLRMAKILFRTVRTCRRVYPETQVPDLNASRPVCPSQCTGRRGTPMQYCLPCVPGESARFHRLDNSAKVQSKH